MKGSILELTLLATSIFTLATSKTLKNLPQLRTNATLHQAGQILTTSNTPNTPNLAPRDYYTCSPGYSSCAYDSTRCCPSDNTCCGNGYCADPGDVCCTVGTCPSGWDCCGNEGYCSPVDGECCSDGYYCFAGTHCRIWDGERVCCPAGGCLGSSDEGELGSTISAGPIGSMTTDTVTTEPSVSYSYTSSVGYVDYEYYYTTVYWTYWFYFWTSYYPYTVQTVTSTETTTSTIWSVYATNSAEASESLSYSVESYSFSTPYSATYLESSTSAVPLSTGGVTGLPPISSVPNGPGGSLNSVSGAPDDDRFVMLMGMVAAGVVGAVALVL